MPFPLIPAALGVCFLLVWAFIGGMIFRDGQLAVRGEYDAELNILTLTAPRSARQRSERMRRANVSRAAPARAAS
jgi:hypothetical protein